MKRKRLSVLLLGGAALSALLTGCGGGGGGGGGTPPKTDTSVEIYVEPNRPIGAFEIDFYGVEKPLYRKLRFAMNDKVFSENGNESFILPVKYKNKKIYMGAYSIGKAPQAGGSLLVTKVKSGGRKLEALRRSVKCVDKSGLQVQCRLRFEEK